MIAADYIAIGAACLFAVFGAVLGFGRCLRILNKGITGKVITLVVTYFIFGIVITMDQTKAAQAKFVEFLQSKDNAFCNFLVTIRAETILTGIIVFVAVMILQLIVVNVIAGILSADGKGVKLFNSILGVALGVAECIALALIVLEVLYLVGGGADGNMVETLKGSFFSLDKIYLDNPLSAIFRI